MKGYVYFIGVKEKRGLVKIGHTTQSVEKRLKQLQTSTPYILYLMDCIKTQNCKILEKKLHSYFNKFHVRGEWFYAPYYDLKKMALDYIKDQNISMQIREIKSEQIMQSKPKRKRQLKIDISNEIHFLKNVFVLPQDYGYSTQKLTKLSFIDIVRLYPNKDNRFMMKLKTALNYLDIQCSYKNSNPYDWQNRFYYVMFRNESILNTYTP
jgi:hypothetical protein